MAKAKKTTEEEVPEKKSTKKTGKIIFIINDRDGKDGKSQRVFDEETHGEDYKDLADSFAESEKRSILERIDE